MKCECPHCGQKYELDNSCDGKTAECSRCQQNFVVEFVLKSVKIDTKASADRYSNPRHASGAVFLEDRKKATNADYEFYSQATTAISNIPKSRIIYVLLAIFLGGIGIHNFYAERNGCGIIALLLGLTGFGLFITWPWAIIDIVTVSKDGKGVSFQ